MIRKYFKKACTRLVSVPARASGGSVAGYNNRGISSLGISVHCERQDAH